MLEGSFGRMNTEKGKSEIITLEIKDLFKTSFYLPGPG